MIKICSWNVAGFDVHKLENVVNIFDIFGLVETWTKNDSQIDLPNYQYYHVPGTRKYKKGRYSGGIILYYHKRLENSIKLVKKTNHCIWIKLDKAFFQTDKDIYLALIYIRPYNSNNDCEENYHDLSRDIACFSNYGEIFLMGDMNARTGNSDDYVRDDSFFPGNDSALLPDNYICDLDIERYNNDTTLNKPGKLLLEICIESKLRILNGRSIGDSVGNFTFLDSSGGCSVIDYMIVSESLYDRIIYFNVLPPMEESDHCIIRCGIKLHNQCFENESDEGTEWSGKFNWNATNGNQYRDQLLHDNSKTKIAELMANIDCNSFDSIDSLVRDFSKIVTDVASDSVKFKSHIPKKRKRKRKQKWFNGNCFIFRREVRKLGKEVQKDPLNNTNRQNFCRAKKEYKKFIKTCKKEFYENLFSQIDMYENKNSSALWKIVDNIRKDDSYTSNPR